MTIRRLRRPPRRTAAWAVSRSLPSTPAEMDPPRRFDDMFLNPGGEPGAGGSEHRSRKNRLRWRGQGHGRGHDRGRMWDIVGDRAWAPVILVTPGWGDSRVTMLGRVAALASMASRVVVWDPPGHGEAGGLCPLGTREPEFIARLAAWAHETHARPVVLFGFSLGAGASIVAAAEEAARGGTGAIAGVVAEAPYRLPWTPARNVLALAGLPRATVVPTAFALLGVRLGVGPRWRGAHGGAGFDRAAHASRLRVPLLVIHGEADEICPIADGEAIAAAAGAMGSLVRVPGATHNEMWTVPESARAASGAVREWLLRIRPGSSDEARAGRGSMMERS